MVPGRCAHVDLYEKAIPTYQSLLKAYMDYLMMTGLWIILSTVRPVACLSIANHSGGDEPRIAGEACWIPRAGSQTEPSSIPNQPILVPP